tara:strand:+ start:3318 stop:3935 length:618 start_codon:yes stop_codon:yes gene_type:complete
MRLTKAAMFGLDARIALAIFGALSVISGAALYSAIENAKATAVFTEIQELGKAFESYYIDTGSFPSVENADSSNWGHYVFLTKELSKNGENKSNWQGPYTPLPINSNDVEHPVYGDAFIGIYEIDNGWYDFIGADAKCDNAGETCAIWVGFDGMDSLELIKSVDRLIDGEESLPERNGSIRYKTNVSSPYRGTILYKYMPARNTN